jgi:hypothetical protein
MLPALTGKITQLTPDFGPEAILLNIGVHDGILDKKHVDGMGSAVWLYLWCLRHQTRHNGLVLGGTPITYAFINQRLGQPERTVRRWAFLLRKLGYIEVTYLNYKKMRIKVSKSKKFTFKQLSLISARNGRSIRPEMADSTPSIRPEMADSDTQNGRFKQSGSMRSRKPEIEEAEEGIHGGNGNSTTSAATIQAFKALECDPFGGVKFKEFWTVAHQNYANGSWVDTMEQVIEKCQANRVSVPPRFFHLKRRIEKIEAEQAFRKTPL